MRGGMKFGRICGQSVGLKRNSRESAPILVYWGVVMGSRVGCTSVPSSLGDDDRFPNKQILTEAQGCLNNMLSASGFSARQMVLGCNPVDLLGWEDKDGDLTSAQDTSAAGQFVQKWKLDGRKMQAAFAVARRDS